ncbi:MAG: SpoIIE family protein phosphatase [Flavobacteriales bacterium]|nr:SpoIIE family protein phosphatase [Flavobacteriales bacterium]
MRIIFLVIILSLFQQIFSQEKMTVKGVYSGKNLYVQNPLKEEFGGGFCVTRVLLNGKATETTTNAHAFELNLSDKLLKIGDSIIIVFEHYTGCSPRILNPIVINDNQANRNLDLRSKEHTKERLKLYNRHTPRKQKKSQKIIHNEFIRFIGYNYSATQIFNEDLISLKKELSMGRINKLDEDSLYSGLWLKNNFMTRESKKSSKNWLENKKMEFAFLNNFEVEIQKNDFSLEKGSKVKIVKKSVDLENQKIIEKHIYISKNQKKIQDDIKEVLPQKDTLFEAGYYWKGLKVGKWVNYSVDGIKKSNIEFYLGEPNGFYQVYHSNGQISEMGYWEKNRNIGEFNTFYEDGNKSQQFTFNANGKREGVAKHFYKNGIISSYYYLKNGIQTGFFLDFDSLGNLAHIKFCLYGDCIDTVLQNNAPIEMMMLAVNTENQAEINKQEVVLLNTRVQYEQNQKKKYIIGISIIFIISLLLFWLLFKIRKSKNQISKQMKVIEEQKTVVEKAHHELEEKNKEIMDSITYAKRIQSAILPPQKLVKEYLPQSFILYKPKDIVAGDFYWMECLSAVHCSLFTVNSEQSTDNSKLILFAAADCTGHGVPGAMVSVVCNNGLNRSVREHGLTEPGKILDKTREIVIQEFEKSDEEVKDGMDISLCCLDLNSNKLTWSGANNPLWIIRNKEIIEYKADKQPIGKYAESIPFTTHEIQLQNDDSIYIFTDGYQDQFGGDKGKKFKAAKLRELLLSIQHEPMENQREIIDQSFEVWKGNLEQVDDVCVIGVKI